MDQNMQDLIKKCIEGDQRSQKVFYDKYKARFYAVCLRYSSSPEEAQDILIEAFLKVFKYLKNYRGEGGFDGWLYKIFVNHAINYVYKNEKDILSPKNVQDLDSVKLTERNEAFSSEMRDVLLRYLQLLNIRERTIFNMVAIEEYTFAEVADELQIKKSVVKTYYYRARGNLQMMIQKNEKELLNEYNLKH
jgi:RNA polymerase sigma-70 factor (ECF subfamily)